MVLLAANGVHHPLGEAFNKAPGALGFLFARLFHHVDARLRLQAQPLTNQAGAAFRGVAAVAGGLPRGAHGVVHIVVVASAVAVAVHRCVIGLPGPLVNGAVELAAHRNTIDGEQFRVTLLRNQRGTFRR